MVTVLYPICKNQFIMYQLIHEKEGIRKLYESCYRDNLHSLWAGQELYRKGNSEEEFINILEKTCSLCMILPGGRDMKSGTGAEGAIF